MEIAILGGTGDVGRGLVLRWARDAEHDLVVGSRSESRATDAAAAYREQLAAHAGHGDHEAVLGAGSIEGRTNEAAVADADVVIAAVPPEYVRATIESVTESTPRDAILVSPAVALSFDEAGAHYEQPPEGSFTAVAADAAPASVPVVGTFHTLSAPRLADLDRELDVDALVVGDDPAARERVADLVTDVEGLRALDAGPLANAGAVEGLTPLQITVGRHNDGLRHLGVRFE